MLESACEDFEILQRLIRREIKLVSGSGLENHRAPARIQMALAKSFVFHVVRARRICEHGAGSLTVNRTKRKLFLKGTADVLRVRDVNEHGFDARTIGEAQRRHDDEVQPDLPLASPTHRRPHHLGGSSRGKTSKPSMHNHAQESAIVDETSMVVLGDTDGAAKPTRHIYSHRPYANACRICQPSTTGVCARFLILVTCAGRCPIPSFGAGPPRRHFPSRT
jgi:hypothetical protein